MFTQSPKFIRVFLFGVLTLVKILIKEILKMEYFKKLNKIIFHTKILISTNKTA